MPNANCQNKKAMNELESGQILEVHATDKGAKNDLTAWSKSGGHDLLEQTDEGDILKFWIQKANECERVSNRKIPFSYERRQIKWILPLSQLFSL